VNLADTLSEALLRPGAILLNKSIFPHSAVLATALSFAALTVVANAAVAGPGGSGAPVPIGQVRDIAYGPGGSGAPVPIGRGLVDGPGGSGAPVPIGQVREIAFGPGGSGAPVPIGRG